MFGNFAITKNEQIRAKKKNVDPKLLVVLDPKTFREKPISENLTSDYKNQWRNYYALIPGGPQPQWAKWGPPGLGDRAKTLASASDMLQCRFLTIRIL
jgi:hypothetical protein